MTSHYNLPRQNAALNTPLQPPHGLSTAEIMIFGRLKSLSNKHTILLYFSNWDVQKHWLELCIFDEHKLI